MNVPWQVVGLICEVADKAVNRFWPAQAWDVARGRDYEAVVKRTPGDDLNDVEAETDSLEAGELRRRFYCNRCGGGYYTGEHACLRGSAVRSADLSSPVPPGDDTGSEGGSPPVPPSEPTNEWSTLLDCVATAIEESLEQLADVLEVRATVDRATCEMAAQNALNAVLKHTNSVDPVAARIEADRQYQWDILGGSSPY